MDVTIETDRLKISLLSEKDYNFIYELLNTDGWIKYIGNRNINSEKDVIHYIQKVTMNSQITYWIVKRKQGDIPMGLVTLIKRDYLEFEDIGFAFLPQFFNNGYALEASKAILRDLKSNNKIEYILAICIIDNIPSIRLIEKLGLRFEKTICEDNTDLSIYKVSIQELAL